jgi:hypothetical protein
MHEFAAANLRGTGYVARDLVWEELSGTIADGTQVRVRARFAGLEGYLLSKCVAVRTRAATKDYYDLVHVLLHNRAAAPNRQRSVCSTKGSPTLSERCARPLSRYGSATGRRPTAGRSDMPEQAVDVEPEADPALLRADAVDVVQRFVEALGI